MHTAGARIIDERHTLLQGRQRQIIHILLPRGQELQRGRERDRERASAGTDSVDNRWLKHTARARTAREHALQHGRPLRVLGEPGDVAA